MNRNRWCFFHKIRHENVNFNKQIDLQIRGFCVKNALFPTDLQDYLQYKHWISLLFIWRSYHVKTDFTKCSFIDGNVLLLFFYMLLYRCSFCNVYPFSKQAILLSIWITYIKEDKKQCIKTRHLLKCKVKSIIKTHL